MLTAEQLREMESSRRKALEDTDKEQHLKLLEQRQREIDEARNSHLDKPHWKKIIESMEAAAKNGERECQVVTFPSDICTDSGRAINSNTAEWPATLQGEAAEIYQAWSSELAGLGYKLAARVLTFPDGMPGDIGLFIAWGG
ncbi:MAG: hypothetical protein P4M00_19095 [Azospirillaceae bacterium]|nr:hypothetical protein [Azospirillaceae bacterium]